MLTALDAPAVTGCTAEVASRLVSDVLASVLKSEVDLSRLPVGALLRIVDMVDGGLVLDARDGRHRDAGALGDVLLGVTGVAEYLDLVTLEQR